MEYGFYKNDNGILLYAPNFVYNKDYELIIENKDNYNYPIDGWKYFETKQEALSFFNIQEDIKHDDANMTEMM